MMHARPGRHSASAALLLVLAAVFVPAGAWPAAAQGALPDSAITRAEPVLRPGDVVRITVWRKPELSGEFEVADDGTVGEPFYMSVTVAGIPFTEAATRVRAHVERFETQPQVLVEPLFRVGVGGEVQRPDMYTFGHSVTVGQVVLLAGGPTPRGDPGRVWLYRAGDRLRVNMYQPDDPVARSPIRSGDYVVVESERQVVRDYVLPTLLAVGATASIARLLIR
jgi:protein involved in polysaccharide export with SLBB domain